MYGTSTSAGEAVATKALKSAAKKNYSKVDYGQISKLLDAAKQSGSKGVTKVSKLKAVSKKATEEKKLEIHKDIWMKEQRKLEQNRLKLEFKIESNLAFEPTNTQEVDVFYSDIQSLYARHVEDLYNIKFAVLAKVAELREAAHLLSSRHGKNNSDEDAINLNVSDNLGQLRGLTELLEAENKKLSKPVFGLEQYIDGFTDVMGSSMFLSPEQTHQSTMHAMDTGNGETPEPIFLDVPDRLSPHRINGEWDQEIFDIESIIPQLASCPDEELYLSIHAEFQTILEQSCLRQEKLQNVYRDNDHGKYCGWARQDHLWYLKLEKEYLNNKKIDERAKTVTSSVRQLMFERMMLERRDLSRDKLISHEKLLDSRRYYCKQMRYLQSQRKEDILNLRGHAEVALQRAAELEKEQLSKEEEQDAFDQFRLELRSRLLRWKKKRLEEIHREEVERGTKLSLQEQWQAHEEERQKKERQLLKASIDMYHEEKQRVLEAKNEAEKKLLEINRTENARRAKLNEGRVELRKQLQIEKERKKEFDRQMRIELNRQREARLEALRASVKVTAERDPERVLQHTAASSAAAEAGEKERIAASFVSGRNWTNYGYSEAEMKQDKRVRMEMLLRQQGLNGSEYARQAMLSIHPPSKPRPDMKSAVFSDAHN